MRDAKAAGLSGDECKEIVDFIAANPNAGNEIKGTGGARKVRFAGKGKGKSGGYRVITFFSGNDIPVFLLNVFAKNEKTDLSQAERNEFKSVLAALADAYRRRKLL
ncbi:MAG: type II toxin-antitoxin system RelE/ParE family toxin [Burkholderiales bacterium]